MKPFIKSGKGEASWTATLLVLFFVLFVCVINFGIWCSADIAANAQKSWDMVLYAVFGTMTLYLGRRGTEVYERVKNGADAYGQVKDLISKTLSKEEEKE